MDAPPALPGGLDWHPVLVLLSPALTACVTAGAAWLGGWGLRSVRTALVPPLALQAFLVWRGDLAAELAGPAVRWLAPTWPGFAVALILGLYAWSATAPPWQSAARRALWAACLLAAPLVPVPALACTAGATVPTAARWAMVAVTPLVLWNLPAAATACALAWAAAALWMPGRRKWLPLGAAAAWAFAVVGIMF